jgi:hypothetical protein
LRLVRSPLGSPGFHPTGAVLTGSFNRRGRPSRTMI